VFPASRPSRGAVSCVALGLPGTPPKGVVPRYPPRGVLHDCSRPVPGSCRGVVSPLTGGFLRISATSSPRLAGPGAVSRHPLPRSGGDPVLWFSDSAPLGLALWRHTAGDRLVHRAGEPSGQSHKSVTASRDWGYDPLGRHLCRHRADDPVGRYRVLRASRVVRGPHPRGGILIFPVPASRGGMASFTAPDALAAMAVDREAEGAGALLGPEEDIDDDVLFSLLSASWPTSAVVDDQYGRFPWTPLGGSIVEQRYEAIDSRRVTSRWTAIRGMYDTRYAVPEGTVTDLPFLRSREDWRV